MHPVAVLGRVKLSTDASGMKVLIWPLGQTTRVPDRLKIVPVLPDRHTTSVEPSLNSCSRLWKLTIATARISL